ncbi:MAG: hypothetical protein AAB074_09375 [Planctomycetota bacterium]
MTLRSCLLILLTCGAAARAEEAVRLGVAWKMDKMVEVQQTVEFRSEGLDKDGKALGTGSGRTEFTLDEIWTEFCEQKAEPIGKPAVRRRFVTSRLAIGKDPPQATRTEGSEVLTELTFSPTSTTIVRGNASDSTLAVLGRGGWEPATTMLPKIAVKPGTQIRDLDAGPFLRVSLASLCGALGPTPEKIAGTYGKTLAQGALPCWQAQGNGEVKLDGNIATLTITGKDAVDDHTPPTAIRGRARGTYEVKGRFVLNYKTSVAISIEIEVNQTIEFSPLLAAAPTGSQAAKFRESMKVVRRYGEAK